MTTAMDSSTVPILVPVACNDKVELSILKLNAITREPMTTAMDSSTVPILDHVACND